MSNIEHERAILSLSDNELLGLYNIALSCWSSLMFSSSEDLLPCSNEQILESLSFWTSRLNQIQLELKKRNISRS